MNTFSKDRFPRTFELKQTIRSKEIAAQNLLTDIGSELGLGRGYLVSDSAEIYGSLATGLGLCPLASAMAKLGLERRHPDLKITMQEGEVLSFCSPPKKRRDEFFFNHVWDRFQFPGEPTFFMDIVYGQVNPLLNRIVIDYADKERAYYPRLRSQTEAPQKPLYTYLLNYAGIFEEIKDRELTEEAFDRVTNLSKELEKLFAA